MAETNDEAAMAAMLDLSKKKKKKKKKESSTSTTAGDSESKLSPIVTEEIDENDTNGNYDYEEMLDKIVNILNANNPELIDKKRHTMKPPQLMRLVYRSQIDIEFEEGRG